MPKVWQQKKKMKREGEGMAMWFHGVVKVVTDWRIGWIRHGVGLRRKRSGSVVCENDRV